MRGMNIRFETCFGRRHVAAVVSAMFALLVAGYPQAGLAQPTSQKTFPSAEEATGALIVAVQNHDEPAITNILGAGTELTSLDDQVQNKVERELFIQKYKEMHRLVPEPDGTTALYIGAENWPFPVPLVSTNGAWYFDSTAGAEEVLFRRIGENEAAAIDVCHALVLAERQRKAQPEGDHSASQYPDEARSTIRALLTSASNGGPATQNKDPASFHGYHFRILTGKGRNTPGEAKGRISDGKMSGGFAFVAYPTDYRLSGVMTFIVNRDDVVYQKDLGPNTAKLARAMAEYSPDSTWYAAE